MTPAELLKVYNALDNSRKVHPLRIVLAEEQAPGAAPVLLARADAGRSWSHVTRSSAPLAACRATRAKPVPAKGRGPAWSVGLVQRLLQEPNPR